MRKILVVLAVLGLGFAAAITTACTGGCAGCG
jgi:hypothetical protein